MSSFQRVIKYCAMGFAIFLTVMIVSGIASAVFAIINIAPGGVMKTGHWKNEKTVDYSESFTNVTSLDIDHTIGQLKIEVGENFRVEAENVSKNFKAEIDDNGKLSISEGDKGGHFLWFNFSGFYHPNAKVIIYLPANFVAEKALIDAGAGNIAIEGLHANYLEISAGAGNIDGSNMVAQNVSIDGGVGNIKLDDVDFTDAEFDCGVGNLDVSGKLVGNTEISCGVGEVDLDLIGNENDYNFNADSGIGTIRLNGEKISGNQSSSDARNDIQIDGGVGSVDISMDQE